MKIKNYIINEQSSSGTTAATPTITTIELKDALNFGCFSNERYPWFTVDAGEQPKTVTEDIVTGNGTGATITKGTKLISGTNSKKNPVYFILDQSGQPKGYYIGKIGGVKNDWACEEVLKLKQAKEKFIDDFILKNKSFSKEEPSLYKLSVNWKKVDVSTLDKTNTFKPGERYIYQQIGLDNTLANQYPNIEQLLQQTGWTLVEPSITSSLWNTKLPIYKLNNKYKPFFDEQLKNGIQVNVWRSSDDGIEKPTFDKDMSGKEAKKQSKVGGLSRSDCKGWIKALTNLERKQVSLDDKDLLIAQEKVFACWKQFGRDGSYVEGAFGVGDELNRLASDSKYGIYNRISQMNESKLLKNIIKENLIKKSEQKQNKLLSENTIIVNRYKLLGEGVKPKTRKEFNKFLESVLNETTYLHSQGYDNELIKEGFMDLLRGVFGQASTGIFQYFQEQIGRWLLNKLGMDTNSWMGNIIVTTIGNVPLTELPNLTNCTYLSNLLSKSVAEGAVNKIKNEQGLTGPGYDILRNSLIELAEDSTFGQKIEHKISDFICPQLQKIKGNLDGVTDKMKSNALGLGDKSKKLATSTVDKVKGLVSK